MVLVLSLNTLAAPYRFKKYSGDIIRVSWDASATIDNRIVYVVALFNMSNNTGYEAPPTTGLSAAVMIPKVGVYEVRVKACIEDACSDWIKSTNPNDVAMEEGAFLIEASLAPAGKPIFEENNK